MMTLDDAVELVNHAFENANNGDIFVQKSPSVTIQTLAEALISLYNSSSKIKHIGVRHGEKMYETLVTKEEMNYSEDIGNYYRIVPDTRDLNYDKYFSKGKTDKQIGEYNSNNTTKLNVKEMKDLLLNLEEIKNDLKS